MFDWSVLDERLKEWRRAGLRVGFTNGCFDLLHRGHIKLLAEARAACDRLVVGLNSDASTKRLKGNGRPINAAEGRAEVLAALEAVDLVVVFEEDTPLELIKRVRPGVLVKGSDYKRDEVVGGDQGVGAAAAGRSGDEKDSFGAEADGLEVVVRDPDGRALVGRGGQVAEPDQLG